MKIGQLTFHASHNYGSVLQAYAMSKILQNLGHESEFINLSRVCMLCDVGQHAPSYSFIIEIISV